MVDISPIEPTTTVHTSPSSAPRRGALHIALLVALVLVIGPACSHSESASKGATLPDATLADLATGKATDWNLDDKPTVINLWATWCAPCRAEMPAFERVHQRLGNEVAIVGITDEDDTASVRAAAKKSGVTYRMLVDKDQTLMVDLNLTGLPATVFVDADGKIVGRHAGAMTEAQLTKEIEDRYGIAA